MDHQLPVASDDGDLSWSDSYSMESDDGRSVMMPNSPSWMEHFTAEPVSMSVGTTMNISHTGQLSPISNGMDFPGGHSHGTIGPADASGHSSTPTMIHSASASSTDSWGMEYMGSDDMAGVNNSGSEADIHWEQEADDIMTIPKLEPLDDDELRLDELTEAPSNLLADVGTEPGKTKVKRPRGRPRKHPLTPIVTTNKITKGRSKTGCLTCRKRKKKCDEAKPRCMNCEKNSVFCEGYPEKQIWKSGKERAEEDRLNADCLPSITMQPLFHGLETVEDRIFWKHYNEHLSSVLTVEGEHKNAFKDMIVPIAVKHHGLMHSILSLSSKHIDYDTPYGLNLLRNNPSTNLEALQQRSDFHHTKAYEKLREDIARQVDRSSPDYKDILSGRYGQMLCFILESMVEGNPRGEHRFHLQAYHRLIQHSPPEDPAFLAFITEFFQYHIFADELIRFPDGNTERLASENWTAPVDIHPPRLIGVADGLFSHLSHITTIRHIIRSNMDNRIDPVDYTSLYQAAEIDAAIQDWVPHFPPGDSRDRVGLLYKQMMWVYLFRTIYPPSQTPLASISSSATSLPMHSIVNTPPRSVSASCASSPQLLATPSSMRTTANNGPELSENALPRRGSTANMSFAHNQRHGQADVRADSPKPIRQPMNHDPRITVAVEESLTILESFKPSDPSQTLLLVPCLIIGSACFTPTQQERIGACIRRVKGYTGLRHTDRVAEVLQEVWRLMDAGEWVAVWDWQRVARRMNLDFLL
ncbi:fungal-specific transcription factor domain-containing protein [Coniochaeta sp. 2T2.1]|nr:fungal-specific transcription factor domain-containing protein [Coniochaeta sp. 2T2.1]